MKITALIFDLGGVVFNFSFDNTFDIWSVETGKNADELKRRFNFSDSNFEKFERSDITRMQFIDSISKQLDFKFDFKTFEKGWNSIYMESIQDMDQLLMDLKKQFRLVALTNTNEIHAEVWKKKYKDILQHFEKVFCSYEIRTRKPETKAFQVVLNYLNLSPNETIFLDDKEEFINGAKQLGINTILVTSFNQMLQELKEYNVPKSLAE